jgi:hypothetical protein
VDPLPRLRVSSTIDTQRAPVEMAHARASYMAMYVVTVGTRAKPLRRDNEI